MFMMDAVTYIKERERMKKNGFDFHNVAGVCSGCDFKGTCTEYGSCDWFEAKHSEKAVEIVQRWAESHKAKTIKQDFFEKYPNASRDKDGIPLIRPCFLGYITFNEEKCKSGDCACWDTTIEGCEK